MTEQDRKYVIEALEYALHKCINVDGDAETHYNTLANALEVVKNCSIHSVVCSYLILDKTNKVVAEKATLKEAEMYVKARPYLKYEKFETPTESVACDLDSIL